MLISTFIRVSNQKNHEKHFQTPLFTYRSTIQEAKNGLLPGEYRLKVV